MYTATILGPRISNVLMRIFLCLACISVTSCYVVTDETMIEDQGRQLGCANDLDCVGTSFCSFAHIIDDQECSCDRSTGCDAYCECDLECGLCVCGENESEDDSIAMPFCDSCTNSGQSFPDCGR